MNIQRLLTTTAILMLFIGTASAQQEEKGKLKSWTFIEVQGGAQLTTTQYRKDKLVTPTGAFSIGHYFTPAIGVRLHANGGKAKAGFENYRRTYAWKYVTTDLDLMVNMTNLFSQKPNHFLNVIAIGGFGLTRAWDNDELKGILAEYPSIQAPLAWNKNRLVHNLRAGLRLETDVTKPIGISLEVNANSLDDRFNSKCNNADDWQWTAMLGVSVRLGRKYTKPAPVPQPVVQEPVEVAPIPEPEEVAPAPVVVEKKPVVIKENLHEEIFYAIRESDPTAFNAKMNKIADFMKRNPDAQITAVGYADKGTGTPKLNMQYSQKRAQNFKNELVEKYEADGTRITTDAKGDTVQPFSENDKNRCVIVDGTGSHTEYK